MPRYDDTLDHPIPLPTLDCSNGTAIRVESLLLTCCLQCVAMNASTAMNTPVVSKFAKYAPPYSLSGQEQARQKTPSEIKKEVEEKSRLFAMQQLRDGLSRFLRDDNGRQLQEQIRSAEQRLEEAAEQGGSTPYVVFKEIISTTALAQDMDALYGSQGGLDYYLRNGSPRGSLDMAIRDYDPINAESKKSMRRRKVQEIKSLMASMETKETKELVQAIEASHIADGTGWGH